MFNKRACIVLLSLFGLAALVPAARSDDYFKGKTFTIVVGFSPAGGYDNYARVLARYIGKYISGHPTVIVQNMPGAGSLTSVRYLDLTAPKDGTAMTIFNPGLVTQSIVEPDRVRLDFRKFAWVGVVTPDYRVCYGYGPNGIKSWDQLMHGGKQFIIGSTGKGSGNYINGATLRIVFHAPVKQVLGFPGSAEQRLAIEQGELDGDCGSYKLDPDRLDQKGFGAQFRSFHQQSSPGDFRRAQSISAVSPPATNNGSCCACSTAAMRSDGRSSCRSRCRPIVLPSFARRSTTP